MDAVAVDLRCSAQARALATDPGGTAVAANAFLLVEVPLPWPNDIGDHPAVADAADVIKALGARLQAVVPSRDDPAHAQAMLYAHDGGPFLRYTRRNAGLDEQDLRAGIRSLVDAPVIVDGTRDLLVCTHGARDRCCGAMGTTLAMRTQPNDGLHVRRTSHLGGHRFAPTALLLPEGTAWAWLDDALLDCILNRSGDLTDVLPHYRGSAAMATPALQLLERAAFADAGWEFLDVARQGETVAVDGLRTTVRVETATGAWTGVVEQVGTTPQPVCGEELRAAKKVDDVLKLIEVRAD